MFICHLDSLFDEVLIKFSVIKVFLNACLFKLIDRSYFV